MSFWDTLGIEATDDLTVIKKAYARKLRENHPEDNPTGFQALKEAYDSAVRYSKYQSIPDGMEIDDADIVGTTDKSSVEADPLPLSPISSYIGQSISFDWQKANVEFIRQMEEIYSDFPKRIKIENWIRLLNDDILWNIENRATLDNLVLDFLSTHYYLPQNVMKLLDENFNLMEREDELGYGFDFSFAKHVMKVLNQPFPLNYSFIEGREGFPYDTYFELKDQIYDLLQLKDSREAEKVLHKAKDIYDQDPDLIRMEGIIYFLIWKFDIALEYFSQALMMNPEDLESYYYRAEILFNKKKYSKALEDLDKILVLLPAYQKAIVLAFHCHLNLGKLQKATDSILQGLKFAQSEHAQETMLKYIKLLKDKLYFCMIIKPWTIKQSIHLLLQVKEATRKPFRLQSFNYYFAKLCKFMLYALLVLLAIGFMIATKLGGIVLIFFIVRQFSKKDRV